MRPGLVTDASMAVGWVHAAQATPETSALLDEVAEGGRLEVPALWPMEVANALTVLVRRGRLTEEQRQRGLVWLRSLPLRIDHEMASLAFSRLSEIAAQYRLSVYDAAYLELAERRMLALACRDGALREAAKQARVRLWQPRE